MSELLIDKITVNDIPDKVNWYNNEAINKYLHYEEPFTIEKSIKWLEKVENDNTRYENVIRIRENGVLKNIGIIGLFNIDMQNRKAGFYITLGEKEYQGKGYAKKATIAFLKHCFFKFELEKVYLYTDRENIQAQKLYEKLGFTKEGILRKEIVYGERFIDRCYYGILRDEYFSLYLK